MPKALNLPIRAVFYQAGVGVVARATIVGARSTKTLGANPLPGLPTAWFPIALDLEDVRIFDQAIDVRPLIASLEFVSNKRYWGHSFRFSPRRIGAADFDALVGVEAASTAR